MTSTSTKHKLKTQAEADVVLHLWSIGCEAGTHISAENVYPYMDTSNSHNRHTLCTLLDRFDCPNSIEGTGFYRILTKELFDAYDQWVDNHQED